MRLVARYAALLLAVLALNFALPRLLPGDPLDFESDAGTSSQLLTAQARADLRASYHLDQPLAAQFSLYLADLMHGNLGWSISRAAPVATVVGQRLPWTLGLVGGTFLLAFLLGSSLGTFAAWRGGRADRLATTIVAGLAALPEMLVALALLIVLAVWLGWFPLSGLRTSVFGSSGGPADWLDVAWHLALPVATLTVATTAGFALVARGAVRTELGEPYLATARAKGLGGRTIALRHALPNALPPVLTFSAVRLGQVLGGAVVVERVFAIPGLGLLAYEAIRARDYPVLQAVFLLSSAAMLLTSLVAEVAYTRWPGLAEAHSGG